MLFLEGYVVAAQSKQWQQGLRMMERALELTSEDAEMVTILGMTLDATRQPRRGEFLKKAYQLDPLSIAAMYYAVYLFLQGRQPDAERVVMPLLVSENNNYFVCLWIGMMFSFQQKFEIGERHLGAARNILGEENNALRIITMWSARIQGDLEKADVIGKALLERSVYERVPFVLGPWQDDAIVEIFERLYEWEDIALIGQLFQDKPERFSQEAWDDLLARSNMRELSETTEKGMFRIREDAEREALIAQQIPMDQNLMNAVLGVYKGAYELTFSFREDGLWLKCSIYGMEGPVVRTEANNYELLTEAIRFEFEFDANQQTTGCALYQGTVVRQFTKQS